MLVELHRVQKSFPTPAGMLTVLRGVDLSIREGEFLGMTGPSGSGKTTLLNLIGLLDTPTDGRIVFGGRELDRTDSEAMRTFRRDHLSMIFQKFCLLPHRTALQNVAFRFRYDPGVGRLAAQEIARKTLGQLGLGHLADIKARFLSGGEMQRIAMARAIAKRPLLLLADEPTGNLDAEATGVVMNTLRALNGEGLTVVLATHNPSLLAYCGRHVACEDGRVKEV